MRVAFLVTHLLGTGHLARTSVLADAFTSAGHESLVISGGFPAKLAAPKTAQLQQLPPLRSDASFTALFDRTGAVATPAILEDRSRVIRETITDFGPDVLVTELFPFGRRKLAAEFEAAIDAAREARVFSSIRDILQMPRKPGRKEEAETRLRDRYHGILFHGDGGLADLDASWPLPASLSSIVARTGYIAPAPPVPNGGMDGTDEIVVAAGGGAVGKALFDTALRTAQAQPKQRWRILVGAHHAPVQSPPSVIVEPVRPDFRAVLTRCRLAVLQCGYNTAMDVAVTGARAVFCPFEGDGETEQLQRAKAMKARYGCGLVREKALDPDGLMSEIDATLASPTPDFSALQRDGARRSVQIVEQALRR